MLTPMPVMKFICVLGAKAYVGSAVLMIFGWCLVDVDGSRTDEQGMNYVVWRKYAPNMTSSTAV